MIREAEVVSSKGAMLFMVFFPVIAWQSFGILFQAVLKEEERSFSQSLQDGGSKSIHRVTASHVVSCIGQGECFPGMIGVRGNTPSTRRVWCLSQKAREAKTQSNRTVPRTSGM